MHVVSTLLGVLMRLKLSGWHASPSLWLSRHPSPPWRGRSKAAGVVCCAWADPQFITLPMNPEQI